ncbi:PH domain-containing protein [Streptomyces acidiscabies]|nr:PH domain-containing protein [Streptomyces acidiscabies]
MTSVNGFRTGWQGIPAFLVTAAIVGRISNSKVVLSGDVLTVVNPLRSHVIPRSAIRRVEVDTGGTLVVRIGGEAALRINGWLRAGGGADAGGPRVQWTRCLSADVSLALCVLTVGVGAVWMAFSGS